MLQENDKIEFKNIWIQLKIKIWIEKDKNSWNILH